MLAAAGIPVNRYADLSRWPARFVLAALAVLIIAAAVIRPQAGNGGRQPDGFSQVLQPGGPAGASAQIRRDDDLHLYDTIIKRVASGDNYYTVAAEEHRAEGYPLIPGLVVRLPTLAIVSAALGEPAMFALSILLVGAALWAWWVRLGSEPGGLRYRPLTMALLAFALTVSITRSHLVLHELWIGSLIVLSLGLHRPHGRWVAALAVAAVALGTRELALPYAVLMGALAAIRRERTEALAWAALLAVALAGYALHAQLVAQAAGPAPEPSQGWLSLRGLAGWLSPVVLASNLRFLPHAVSGPLVILMVLGWSGWKSPLGTTASLLIAGYAGLFMIVGRPDNFYWGAMIAPAMFVGLAFVPQTLTTLWRRAR